MQLEDYFDFLATDDIRIKGTRIGIKHILYEYIHRAQTPEAIAQRFRTGTLEQIHATILYYRHNKDSVSDYIADWLAWSHQMREEQQKNPPGFIEKLRNFKAKKEADIAVLILVRYRIFLDSVPPVCTPVFTGAGCRAGCVYPRAGGGGNDSKGFVPHQFDICYKANISPVEVK